MKLYRRASQLGDRYKIGSFLMRVIWGDDTVCVIQSTIDGETFGKTSTPRRVEERTSDLEQARLAFERINNDVKAGLHENDALDCFIGEDGVLRFEKFKRRERLSDVGIGDDER